MKATPQYPNSTLYCFILAALLSCNTKQCSSQYPPMEKPKQVSTEALVIDSSSLVEELPRIPTAELSQEQILHRVDSNPCYLPLVRDPNYWPPRYDSTTMFRVEDLYNDNIKPNPELEDSLQFVRRYLVGDFMVLNKDESVRGIKEFLPRIEELFDWEPYKSEWLKDVMTFPLYQPDSILDQARDSLINYVNHNHLISPEGQLNFFDKIWRYYGKPIEKTYSFSGNKVYASGQRLCLCEAYEDTLVWVASAGISSKRLDVKQVLRADSTYAKSYFQLLPLNRFRRYYGGQYTISSKHWERSRPYEAIDIEHDTLLSGGHQHVVFYQGRVELPNFLTMQPHKRFTDAVYRNGIHEVSLRQMPRNMLGTCNSIGCIRVSDYVSKFVRWWVPQDCNFFVAYEPERYHALITDVNIADLYPIHSNEEGDLFREWVNDHYPYYAKHIELSRTGDYKNGYIQQAYFELGDEYERSQQHEDE